MAKHIVVVGYGPGVSTAVAEKFGGAGFSVSLVARNQQRLAAGVAALKAKGIAAAAFQADAGDTAAIRSAVGHARATFGAVTVLHWNAFPQSSIDDLLAADPSTIRAAFEIPVVGLLAAAHEALPDLKAAGDGAVLVTNGAFGELSPQIDAFAVSAKAMALALGNAAKHKLVGLLSAQLKEQGVYVGEVMIAGGIKGTPSGNFANAMAGSVVANAFWELYGKRTDIYARVSG